MYVHMISRGKMEFMAFKDLVLDQNLRRQERTVDENPAPYG